MVEIEETKEMREVIEGKLETEGQGETRRQKQLYGVAMEMLRNIKREEWKHVWMNMPATNVIGNREGLKK